MDITTLEALNEALSGRDSLALPNLNERIYRQHEGIAQSDIKPMKLSPKHAYVGYHASRKQDVVEETTPALLFGKAVHKVAFEPEEFDDCFFVPPKIDRRTKKGKEEFAKLEAENAGKQAIEQSEFEHPQARRLFEGGHFEASLFAKDPETGLWLKGRLDGWHENHGIVVDLKTTKSASVHSFPRDIEKYGYDFQMAYYLDLVWRVTGQKPQVGFMVAVEKTVPYDLRIYKMYPSEDCKSYVLGRTLYRRYLNMFKDCMDVDQFPGYPHDIIEPEPSKWRLINEGIEDEDDVV